MVFPFKGLEDFKIDLDQDHELLRTTIRDFLEREVQNRVEEGERKGDLGEVREKIKELGLNGLDVPQEYGELVEITFHFSLPQRRLAGFGPPSPPSS